MRCQGNGGNLRVFGADGLASALTLRTNQGVLLCGQAAKGEASPPEVLQEKLICTVG